MAVGGAGLANFGWWLKNITHMLSNSVESYHYWPPIVLPVRVCRLLVRKDEGEEMRQAAAAASRHVFVDATACKAGMFM